MTGMEFGGSRAAARVQLDPAKARAAAAALRAKFDAVPGVVEDLRARIAEQPLTWLSGRPAALCWNCGGRGVHRRLTREVSKAAEAQREHRHTITAADLEHLEVLRADPANCTEPERCDACCGTGKSHELSLHFAWGMRVRNVLRHLGFDECYMDIDNWDDYYQQIVELAVTD